MFRFWLYFWSDDVTRWKIRLLSLITVHPSGNMKIHYTVWENPSRDCRGLRDKNINLMVTLDEHSGFILWGQRDSSVQSVDTSQPTEHPTQNLDIDLVVAREEKWEDRQTKSGGFILWGTWIHPIEEVKSWRCPAGDRTNHLSFSVYHTLTSTNQINSWRAFRPDESAERRQKTSFPESFFVLIDLMLRRLR